MHLQIAICSFFLGWCREIQQGQLKKGIQSNISTWTDNQLERKPINHHQISCLVEKSVLPTVADIQVGISLRKQYFNCMIRKGAENLFTETVCKESVKRIPPSNPNHWFFRHRSVSSTYPVRPSIKVSDFHSVRVSETSQSVETTLRWPT